MAGDAGASDLWLDDKLIEQGRSEYTYTVVTDEQHEICLKAVGYRDWFLNLSAHVKSNKVFSGVARMEPVMGNKSVLQGAITTA